MNYQEEIDEKVSVLKNILIKASMVLGVTLVVGVAFLAYNSHLESKNTKAADLFYQAHEIEKSTVGKVSTPEESAAMQGFDAKKILELEPAKREAYLKILAEISADYSGTPIWALVQLRRAKIALAQNKPEESEKEYRSVMDASLKSHLFAGLAADGLGVMFEDLGQNDKALEVFKQASAVAKNPLKPLAMMGQARVLTTMGKTGAAEIYENIVKEYPESSYSRRAKVLRSALHESGKTGAL